MSANDPALTLRQIAGYCDRAIELRNSTTHEEFRHDWRKQMLGERLVEVLGEAVKRLPEAVCDRHPEQPWRKIAARGTTSRTATTVWTTMSCGACSMSRRPN